MSTPAIQSDRYELVEQVGKGAAGRLYRGCDLLLQRPIAIKLLESVRDPTRLAFFYSQWAIQASLTHPNIGAVRDIADCASDGQRTPMLVTPWLEGQSLDALTAGKGVSLDTSLAAELIIQAAEGLAHAHERGLVHGNLKRSNVFVCSDGIVKLLDFGPLDPSVALEPHAIQHEDIARLGHLLDGLLDVVAASPALPRLRRAARKARDGGLQHASELPPLLREALGGPPASHSRSGRRSSGSVAQSEGDALNDTKRSTHAESFTGALEAVDDALRPASPSAPAPTVQQESEPRSRPVTAGLAADTETVDLSMTDAPALPEHVVEPRAALQQLESCVAQQEGTAPAALSSPASELERALHEPDLDSRIELLAELQDQKPEDRLIAAALARNERKRDQITAMASRARRLEQDGNLAAARDQWITLTAIHPLGVSADEIGRLEKLIDGSSASEAEPPRTGREPPSQRRGLMRSVSTDSLRLSAEQAAQLKEQERAGDTGADAAGVQRFASTDTLRLTAHQAEVLATSASARPGDAGGRAKDASNGKNLDSQPNDAVEPPDDAAAADAPHDAEPELEFEEEPAFDDAYQLLPSETDSAVREYEEFFDQADPDDGLGSDEVADWGEEATAPLETDTEVTPDPLLDRLAVSPRTLLVAGGSAAIIVLLLLFAFLAKESSAPTAGLELITFKAFPPGAEILIDGVPCGRGECVAELPAGSHRVTARMAGYALAFELLETPSAGAADDDESRTVRLELTALMPGLLVGADLEQATVYMDGREIGKLEDGEFSFAMLPAGEHELRIAGEGVEARTRVFVEPGKAPLVESLSTREARVVVVSGVGDQATLHSNLEGRDVLIDDSPVGRTGSGPLALRAPAEGSHEIVVGGAGERLAVGFDVEDMPRLAMVLQTDRNVGSLRITTEDGATVYLNDRPYRRQTSRGRLTVYLAPNDYHVRVEKEGFRPGLEQTATIRKGEQTRLEFVLEPGTRVSRLRVAGGVPGAAVFVDGEPAGSLDGRGTLTRAGLHPGLHLVEIQAEGYKPLSVRRSFEEGEEVVVPGEMERELAELRIEVMPAGNDVRLSLQRDGESEARPIEDRRLSLIPGTYAIRASVPGYEAANTTVTLRAGATHEAVLILKTAASVEAPPDRTDLLPALHQAGEGWTRAGAAVERIGGEFSAIPGTRGAGVYQFRAKLEKGRRLQWVARYLDENNYRWFQLGRDRFHRTVVAAGERSKAVEVEHGIEDFRDVTVRMEVSPDAIVHSLLVRGKWVEIDHWKITGGGFHEGRVGFRLPGKDHLILEELRFETR